MAVDKVRVGGVCNSLNALSGLHRHKYAKDPTNMTSRNTSDIMDLAQHIIWELWDELELRKDTSMPKEVVGYVCITPSRTNDNQVAINMLNCVSGILRSIESDSAEGIDSALSALKQETINFEKVFHDNLIHNRYR